MLNLGAIQVQIQHMNTVEDLDKVKKDAEDIIRMATKKQIELVKNDPSKWEILLEYYG